MEISEVLRQRQQFGSRLQEFEVEVAALRGSLRTSEFEARSAVSREELAREELAVAERLKQADEAYQRDLFELGKAARDSYEQFEAEVREHRKSLRKNFAQESRSKCTASSFRRTVAEAQQSSEGDEDVLFTHDPWLNEQLSLRGRGRESRGVKGAAADPDRRGTEADPRVSLPPGGLTSGFSRSARASQGMVDGGFSRGAKGAVADPERQGTEADPRENFPPGDPIRGFWGASLEPRENSPSAQSVESVPRNDWWSSGERAQQLIPAQGVGLG
ncbi:MAG: hypothetical protein GY906_20410, partial [bacterium]|nr:hypothetical protein [bacterium]